MSAFVVEPKTINRIVWQLLVEKDRDGFPGQLLAKTEFSIESEEYASDLGLALYNLNMNAVNQRYPDCVPDRAGAERTLPGTYGADDKMLPYKYEAVGIKTLSGLPTSDKYQAIKSLDCWLYQCDEGNVHESTLYKAMEAIRDHWCRRIVTATAEYEAAEWG